MAEPERAKLKVLHLVKTSIGATWAFRQMRELVKLGTEVHVALPSDGPMVAEYVSAGIHVHLVQLDFPVRKLWAFPHYAQNLRDLVAKVGPDLIHSHFVGTTLTMRLALGKKHPTPRIFQVPGPLHLESSFFRSAEIATAGAQDYWIGSCQWTCDCYLASGIAQDRVFLSYYGTDLGRFTSQKSGKLRRELGIRSDTKLVGMVAYMYAPKRYLGQKRGLKGHEDLIDALRLCLEAGAQIKGVFIGGAWNAAVKYERQVRQYGNAQCGDHAVFLGTRSDIVDLYPDLDIAVHPSHSENVGGAVESLLACVPTITTTVGGFPDLISDGQTGWLVPPRSPGRIAASIDDILHDPEGSQAVAECGRDRARRLFDVIRTARQVLGYYQRIIASSKQVQDAF